MVRKILRKIDSGIYILTSELRKLKFFWLYDNIFIDGTTKVESGCKIVCIKGGKITIKNSTISSHTIIVADANAIIEIHNSFIGKNATIVSKQSIVISPNCLIAENVTIRDQDHTFENTNKLIQDQGFNVKPVRLEENVWVASNTVILKGVTLKKGTIVGAGSVVTKSTEDFWIVAGVPAKLIKVNK